MTNSACGQTLVLPVQWYQELVDQHFLHGINLKTFYDHFLVTVGAAECQVLDSMSTWWRHVASRTTNTTGICSGLQVDTQQALSLMVCSTHDAWAYMEVDKILEPLQQMSPPLSNALFEAAFTQLQMDMENQHSAREAQEQAQQHADHEATRHNIIT